MFKGNLYLNINNVKLINNQQTTTYDLNKKTDLTQINLNTLFKNLNSVYQNNIPWNIIKNRAAYQFYPREINGLPIANGEVIINHDANYNSLTVFELTDTISIPLKNAYISYFEIPDILRKKFNLSEIEIVMPLELKVYEFDRNLGENEISVIAKGENFKCINKESKTETIFFSNSQLIIYYCNLNLTDKQKSQIKDKGFFDKIYEIYFIDRNILIQFSVDSNYINNSQDYLFDYLIKLFNSNDSLFITQKQIKSLEDIRKFEEWRRKTFDK